MKAIVALVNITRLLFLAFALSLFAGFTTKTTAQPERNKKFPVVSYWVNAGPNLSTLGVGMSTGLAVKNGRHLFSVRAISTDPDFGSEILEAAFLYGNVFSHGNFQFSAGVGVSVVEGTRYPRLFARGDGEDLDPMIGFPLEGHVYWAPINFAGIGINTFANVNTGQPFGGLALTIRLGHFSR